MIAWKVKSHLSLLNYCFGAFCKVEFWYFLIYCIITFSFSFSRFLQIVSLCFFSCFACFLPAIIIIFLSAHSISSTQYYLKNYVISFVVSLQISLTFCKSFVRLSSIQTFCFHSMQLYRRELTAITWQFSLPYNNQHIVYHLFSFTRQIRLDLIAIFRLRVSFFFHCGLFQQQVSLICAFVASLLFHNLYNTILIIIHPEACFLVV